MTTTGITEMRQNVVNQLFTRSLASHELAYANLYQLLRVAPGDVKLTLLQQLGEFDQTNQVVWRALAQELISAREYAWTRVVLDNLNRTVPEENSTLTLWGDSYLAIGDKAAAQDMYLKALVASPNLNGCMKLVNDFQEVAPESVTVYSNLSDGDAQFQNHLGLGVHYLDVATESLSPVD